jgi:hypothetical protein
MGKSSGNDEKMVIFCHFFRLLMGKNGRKTLNLDLKKLGGELGNLMKIREKIGGFEKHRTKC